MKYEKYDAKADLWSVGAIAYEMVFGAPPYRADNHIHLLRMIEAADDSALPFPSSIKFKQSMRKASSAPSKFSKDKQEIITINIETSDTFRDLILKLLKKDPNKRISFEEFFSHPFVSETFSRPTRPLTKQASTESVSFAPAPPSLTASRRHSQSTISSISSAVEDTFRSEEENSLLLDAFDNLDSKPPVKIDIYMIFIILLFLVVFHYQKLLDAGFDD